MSNQFEDQSNEQHEGEIAKGEAAPAGARKAMDEHLAPDVAHLDTTLEVDSEPFVQFEQWLDSELDKLVTRWLPYAAPNAAHRGIKFGRNR